MTIFKNFFSWITDKWQFFLAVALGFFAYEKWKENQELKTESAVSAAAKKTEQVVEQAEEKEKETVKQAEAQAQEEKEKRDEIIKENKVNEEEKIEKSVKEKINEDVKDPEKLAQDFATTFGGTYVKKDE